MSNQQFTKKTRWSHGPDNHPGKCRNCPICNTKTAACECCDPGCPVHIGKSTCTCEATTTVRRIYMEDGQTKFCMCNECAEDALESGVFA